MRAIATAILVFCGATAIVLVALYLWDRLRGGKHMISGRVEYDQIKAIGDREFLSPSTNRVCLTLFPPDVGSAYVSNDIMSGPQQGLTLRAGMAPVYMDVDHQGETIQRGWHVVYAAGASAIAWISGQG